MNILRRKTFHSSNHLKDFCRLIISSDWLYGKNIETLEKDFALYTGAKYVTCTSFGLHALKIILSFYQISGQDEILIPGYTASVVRRLLDELRINYRCVDIDPQTATMCPLDLEKKISIKTKAVLVTHLLGNVCPEKVFDIARSSGLIIIEDCAHAHGALNHDIHVGRSGHASFFSFSYSKIINTYTGGILLTNNLELHNYAREMVKLATPPLRLQLVRKFLLGHVENLCSIEIVFSSIKFLLRSNRTLKKIKNIINYLTRRRVSHFYLYSNTQAHFAVKQLKDLDLTLKKKHDIAQLIEDNTSLKFLKKNKGDVYYNHIAIVDDPRSMHRYLLDNGVDTGHGNSIMDLIVPDEKLPGCEFAYQHYLLIPNYADLKQEEVWHIIKSINKFGSD